MKPKAKGTVDIGDSEVICHSTKNKETFQILMADSTLYSNDQYAFIKEFVSYFITH